MSTAGKRCVVGFQVNILTTAATTVALTTRYLSLCNTTPEGVKLMSDVMEKLLCTGRQSLAVHQMANEAAQEIENLRYALRQMSKVIRGAGVHNLSNGVQLGQISWSVKMNDALERADRLLPVEELEQ